MDAESLARLLFETDWPTDTWENHNRGKPDAAARRYLMLGEVVYKQFQDVPTETKNRDLDLICYTVNVARRGVTVDSDGGLSYATYDAMDILNEFNSKDEVKE